MKRKQRKCPQCRRWMRAVYYPERRWGKIKWYPIDFKYCPRCERMYSISELEENSEK